MKHSSTPVLQHPCTPELRNSCNSSCVSVTSPRNPCKVPADSTMDYLQKGRRVLQIEIAELQLRRTDVKARQETLYSVDG